MSAYRKSAIMFLVVILAILGEALGQATCGCAPQPTIIQLSCNGGSSGSMPPVAPSPSPAPYTTSITEEATNQYQEEEVTGADEYNWAFQENSCDRGVDGYFIGGPMGGWPAGYIWTETCSEGDPCECDVHLDDPNQPRPPPNWDGDLNSLDFDIGKVGEPTYNMVMCWPVHNNTRCVDWIRRPKEG